MGLGLWDAKESEEKKTLKNGRWERECLCCVYCPSPKPKIILPKSTVVQS